MKDNLFQQRVFILSSFNRLKITICSNVYRFADHMIKYNYVPAHENLDQVDSIIREEYYKYLNNG